MTATNRGSFNRSNALLNGCTIMVVHPYINMNERLIERLISRSVLEVVGRGGGLGLLPASTPNQTTGAAGHSTLSALERLAGR